MVLALNVMADAMETHLLSIAVNIMVSRDTEYPVFRHTRCGADGVQKACHQLVFIGFPRESQVTSRQDEIG